MDYEDIIKLEEQSPVYSTGNNSHNLKQYMAAFYDNDSELQRREAPEQIDNPFYISFEQAIDFVQNYVDIIDTPLEDILLCFDRLQCGQDLDRTILRKKILKRKHLLKRFRAKNRQPKLLCAHEQFPELGSPQIMETEAEIKKKRNRVSAQISRDRKKQYFKELQLKNQKLEEEIIRARLENEKLKQQASKSQPPQPPKIHSQTFNNKLTKLLIFLGVLCLISMLKETFFSTTQSLNKFRTAQKLEQFSSMNTKLLAQQALPKVAEFLDDEQVSRQLFQKSSAKTIDVCGFEESRGNALECGQLAELMEKLDEIKTQVTL